MKTKGLIIGALVALVMLGSCGGNSNKKKVVKGKDAVTQEVINYPIPTAYEVTNLINRSGAAYVIGITNPIDKAERYLTESQKALNIGIYGADLAYVSTYNMKQETMNYMKALKKLVDDLNISTNFNTSLARKIEDNIDNKDSLINIITDSFHDTYAFLVNNGKDDLSLMILTGTWVEGLYLTTQVATTSVKPTDMLQIVANQKQSLNTLVELLEKNVQNPEIAKLLLTLKPIRDEYDDVKNKVSMPQALEITNAIEKIRDNMVK